MEEIKEKSKAFGNTRYDVLHRELSGCSLQLHINAFVQTDPKSED